jgi:hypothetical protein
MDFPTNEAKIKRLCDHMLDGYMWHAPDFPHINRISLHSKRLLYIGAKKAFVEARAKERIATKAKNDSLAELKSVMQNCLRKSIVDTSANPEKLKLIGWSPKAAPQPSDIPAQPLNLRVIAKEGRNIQLEWDSPDVCLAGRPKIRHYVIECCQQNGEGISGWSMIQISYRTQMSLCNQPPKVLLNYRVKAVNMAGESLPSNSVSVVLP